MGHTASSCEPLTAPAAVAAAAPPPSATTPSPALAAAVGACAAAATAAAVAMEPGGLHLSRATCRASRDGGVASLWARTRPQGMGVPGAPGEGQNARLVATAGWGRRPMVQGAAAAATSAALWGQPAGMLSGADSCCCRVQAGPADDSSCSDLNGCTGELWRAACDTVGTGAASQLLSSQMVGCSGGRGLPPGGVLAAFLGARQMVIVLWLNRGARRPLDGEGAGAAGVTAPSRRYVRTAALQGFCCGRSVVLDRRHGGPGAVTAAPTALQFTASCVSAMSLSAPAAAVLLASCRKAVPVASGLGPCPISQGLDSKEHPGCLRSLSAEPPVELQESRVCETESSALA